MCNWQLPALALAPNAAAIVGGNPAKPIRQRFEPEAVAKLNQIAWWGWPVIQRSGGPKIS
jgi:hypothetical protein